MTENQNFYIILALIGLFFIWTIIIFRYYLRIDKGSVELKAGHHENVERIKKLEVENEKKVEKIDELRSKVVELQEKIIQLQTQIMNCEHNQPKKTPKKGGWNGINEDFKKHRKHLE